MLLNPAKVIALRRTESVPTVSNFLFAAHWTQRTKCLLFLPIRWVHGLETDETEHLISAQLPTILQLFNKSFVMGMT